MKTLKESFLEETNQTLEPDAAMFELGKVLGFFPEDAVFNKYSSIFFTDNSLERALYGVLEALDKYKILDKNKDGDFRWVESGSFIQYLNNSKSFNLKDWIAK